MDVKLHHNLFIYYSRKQSLRTDSGSDHIRKNFDSGICLHSGIWASGRNVNCWPRLKRLGMLDDFLVRVRACTEKIP